MVELLEDKEHLHRSTMKGENRIVPDLAAVRFVDSSGIGALVSALKALGGKGDIVLCGVPPLSPRRSA